MDRISLRGYQLDTSNSVTDIFNRKDNEFNRFAAVIVTTGGGKTYIFCDQVLIFENEQFTDKECFNPEITDKNILFIAPNDIIINQTKETLLESIVFDIPNIENMSVKEIIEFVRDNYGKDGKKYYGINRKQFKELVTDSSSKGEKIKALVQSLNRGEVNKLVKRAFPGLDFACYEGLKNIVNKDKKYDLAVFDEAHRTQAITWIEYIDELLNQKNPNCKVMAMTATPEREDSKNGIKDLAYTIYKRDISEKFFMAKNIRLTQAMESGIVIAPKSVHSKSGLIDRYSEILNEYIELIYNSPDINIQTYKANRIAEYEKTLKEMGKILFESEGIPDILEEFKYEIESFKESSQSPEYNNDKEELISSINKRVEDIKETLIKESINNSINKKDAKCLVYVPPFDSTKFKSYDEYFNYYEQKIKEHFSSLTQRLNCNINIKALSSQFSDTENTERINNFENSTDSNTIQVLFAVQKLDEGIHVDGVDACIHLSRTDSAIKKQQRDGRVISSAIPGVPYEEQPKRLVIDCVGNTIIQNLKGTHEIRSISFDVEMARKLSQWVKSNKKLPDINSAYENEARLAFFCKSIQKYYIKYLDEKNINTDEEKEYVPQIIDILKDDIFGNFWSIQFPERTITPTEDEMCGRSMYELDEFEKDFLKLYDGIKENNSKDTRVFSQINRESFDNLMKILKIIIKRKPDIIFPANIKLLGGKKSEYNSKEYKDVKTLEQFLIKNFSEDVAQDIITELYDATHIINIEKIDLLGMLAQVRGRVWCAVGDYREELFYDNNDLRYSMEELVDCGIFGYKRVDKKEFFEAFRVATRTDAKAGYFDIFLDPDNSEYISPNQDYKECGRKESKSINLTREFRNANLYTGIIYDRSGYARDGYNKYLFNRKGINRETGKKYNLRGFDRRLINKLTGTKYDVFGYDINDRDKDGNPRPPYSDSFVKVVLDGREIWVNEETSDIYNKNGEDKYGFRAKDSINSKTRSKYNKRLFYKNENGEYINKLTGTKYDALGYDIDDKGKDENGNEITRPKSEHKFILVELKGFKRWINEDTSDMYGKDGYDKFGFDRNLIHRDTHTKYDKRGFYKNYNGTYVNRLTGKEYDLLGFNIENQGIDNDGNIIQRPESEHKFQKALYRRKESMGSSRYFGFLFSSRI